MNTIFSYLLLVLLIYTGMHYMVAVTVGTILAILLNFKTTGRIVFDNRDNRLIFKFFGVYAINYVFSLTGLWVSNLMGINMNIAVAIILILSALISYLLHRNFVFKTTVVKDTTDAAC